MNCTPTRLLRVLPACLALFAALHPLAAHAERADRDRPVHIKAERNSLDDLNNTHVFDGNVRVTQGTRQILADKLVVTIDADGYYHGVATKGPGGLARFREKREGQDLFIDGEADRIEFDTRTDKVKLFEHARVTKGEGEEIVGRYIERDGYSETFTVSNGPNGTSIRGAQQTEVTLLPKSAKAAPSSQSGPATSKTKP